METYVVARKWWAFLLRGLIAIAFGIIALAWPAATVYVLIIIFGAFAVVDGIFNVIEAIYSASQKERWGMVLAIGLLGILLGGIILSRPDVALLVVVILMGIWAIASGIVELIVAFDMPPESGRGLVGVVGAISVIIGVLLLAIPFKTVYAVILLIGIYALVAGAGLIILSFYALKWQKSAEKE